MGRPTKYDPKFVHELRAYCNVEPYREVFETTTYKDGTTKENYRQVANDIPLTEDFAFKIGVTTETIYQWAKKYKDFSDALKGIKQAQERFLKINGLADNYSTAFAIFSAKNMIGWRDKTEVEHEHKVRVMIDI